MFSVLVGVGDDFFGFENGVDNVIFGFMGMVILMEFFYFGLEIEVKVYVNGVFGFVSSYGGEFLVLMFASR